MKKERLLDYGFIFLVGGLFAYAMSAAILTSTVIEAAPFRLYLNGLAAIFVSLCILYNFKTLLVFVGLAALAGWSMWYSPERWAGVFDHALEVLYFMGGNLSNELGVYERTVEGFVCGAAGFIAALCLYKRFNFILLTLCGIAPFLVGNVMNYNENTTAFLIFMLVFCVLLVRKLNRHAHSITAGLLALPLCLVVVAGVNQIPAQDSRRPMSSLLQAPMERLYDRLYLVFNPKHFSFQATGFAGRGGRLGGPVSINNRAVMEVQARDRVYLAGLTNNHYDGKRWTDTLGPGDLPTGGLAPAHFEMLETAAALMYYTGFYDDAYPYNRMNARDFPTLRLTDENESLLYYRAYLPAEPVVVIAGNPTATVFRPAKSYSLTFYGEGLDHALRLDIGPSGDLQTQQVIPRYTGYGYSHLNVYLPLDIVRDTLSQSHRGAYALGNQTADAAVFDRLYHDFVSNPPSPADLYDFFALLNGFAAGPLKAYADAVYAHYTALPDTLPDRVHDLAYELTREAESDYEKVLAIQQYLLRLPYTLNPPRVPNDVDFVDFFLFEAPEGYCTYFASAMAVLCRSAGIPARYMEGFLTPPEPRDDGWFWVTNANAHAWAEVYLEGYGWLIAEATSPFIFAEERRVSQLTGGGSSLFAESFAGYPNYEQYLQSIGVDLNAAPDDFFWPEPVIVAMAQAPEPRPPLVIRWWYVPPGVLAAGLAFLLYLWVQRAAERVRLWRVGRMDVNQQAQVYYKAVLAITRYHHYPLRKNETPQMYGLRLNKRFAFRSDTIFLRDLTALYYKARYGTSPLSAQELGLLKEAHADMVRLLQYVYSNARFVYLRYVRKITRV